MKEEKAQLYKFILEQLIEDDYLSVAESLSKTTLIPLDPEWTKKKTNQAEEDPHQKLLLETSKKHNNKKYKVEKEETRLLTLVRLGLIKEKEDSSTNKTQYPPVYDPVPSIHGLDHELELQTGYHKRPPPSYNTRFLATHKNQVKVARFSADGKLLATGSADTSIKVINTAQIKRIPPPTTTHSREYERPTVKTFYDHGSSVLNLDFHPTAPILASCSMDCTIRFFDWRDDTGKRSFKTIAEATPVRSIDFHPSGESLLVGTDQNLVRIYDVSTWKAMTSSQSNEHHIGGILQVAFSPQGNLYASASEDGNIKLWDSHTHKVVRTFQHAHEGNPVRSIQFSKNQKYILSNDSRYSMKIWELATGRQMQSIPYPDPTRPHSSTAMWSWNEDFVISAEESVALLFDTRSADLVQRLAGHTGDINSIATSPVEACMVTCSADSRARFWID